MSDFDINSLEKKMISSIDNLKLNFQPRKNIGYYMSVILFVLRILIILHFIQIGKEEQ